MTATPWMPLYVADYLADTGHLTGTEHGAYLLLLMCYWRSGPLSNDFKKLLRICRATSDQEIASVEAVLKEFFSLKYGKYHNKRADEELAEAKSIIRIKTKAGRAGGIAARGKSGRKKNSKTIADVLAEKLQNNSPSPSPSPSPEKEDDDPPQLVTARELLTRVCAILRVELQANPERLNWQRQIEEMLRDGLDEASIIAATEIARTRGITKLSYIRTVAFSGPKPPSTASPPNGSGDEVGERLKAKWAAEDEQERRLRGGVEADAGGAVAAAAGGGEAR